MEICFIIHVLIIVGFDMMVKIQSRSKSKGIQYLGFFTDKSVYRYSNVLLVLSIFKLHVLFFNCRDKLH